MTNQQSNANKTDLKRGRKGWSNEWSDSGRQGSEKGLNPFIKGTYDALIHMLVNEKYTLDTLISNEKYVYLKCPEWNFRVLPVNEDYSFTYDALNELLVGEEGHGGQHVPILLVLLLPEGQPPAPHHQATRPRLGWTRTKDYNNNNDNDSIMVGIRLIIQKDNAILRLAKHKELVLRTGTQGKMDGLANK